MLGKLMKYELKAQYKTFCGMYLFVALSALIAGVANGLESVYPDIILFDMIQTITISLLLFALAVLFIVSAILFLLRYRKNLLKDEGYLMHTLPVSAASLVSSKLLISVVWYLCDCLAAYLAVSLALLRLQWPADLLHYMKAESGQQITGMMLTGLAVYCLICIVTSIAQLYASLSIGYTSVNSNRDIMSFIAYMATYVISQVLSVIGLVVVVIKEYPQLDSFVNNSNSSLEIVQSIFVMAGIMMAVLGIAYYLVSVMMLRKKLNLE